MNTRRPLRDAGLILLLTIVLMIGVLETLGQTQLGDFDALLFFRASTRIVKEDVDHRNAPGSKPGINSDGIRSLREPERVRDEDFNIVFLGDSFVYGMGLHYRQTVPFQLEKILREEVDRRVRVLNFGWISSSPVLSLRLLEDVGARYRPDLILLGLDMTDFRDDLLYSNIIAGNRLFALKKVVPASLVALNLALERIPFLSPVRQVLFGVPSDRYFATNQPLEESAPHLETTVGALREIRDYAAEELGADFALFVFPRGFQYSTTESPNSWERSLYEPLGPYVLEPFRFFEERSDELPYPVFSLLEAFRDTEITPHCFRDDPHWNPAGAGIAAREISRKLLEANLLATVARPEVAARPRPTPAE